MKNQLLILCIMLAVIIAACKKNQTLQSSYVPILSNSTSSFKVLSTATLQVDCGVSFGTFVNMPARSNISNEAPIIGGVPLRTIDNNFLISKNLAPSTARLFISPLTVQENSLTVYDDYILDAARVSDSLLIVFNRDVRSIGDTTVYKTLVGQILNHIWSITQKLKYVEGINEYDNLSPAMSDNQYYTYYALTYRSVNVTNTVNSIPAAKRILVGGPCLITWNPTRIQNFLTNFKNDHNTTKRLDFISYHEYCPYDNGTVGGTKAGELIQLGTRRSVLEGWLSANGLNTHIQTYVTEHVIFPGSTLTRTGTPYNVGTGDYLLIQAASAATYNYYYILNGRTKMFMWDHRLDSNPEKSLLAPQPTYALNTPSPFCNTALALAMLNQSNRVKTTSNLINPTTGYGVYGLATTSTNSVTLMVWNWQHTNTTSNLTNITFSNLPASFAGKQIKLTGRVIDATHANYFNNPATAELSVTDSVSNFNTASTYSITLSPNSLKLITLSVVN